MGAGLYVAAAQCTARAEGRRCWLRECCGLHLPALSEYCLWTDEPLTGTVTWTAGPGRKVPLVERRRVQTSLPWKVWTLLLAQLFIPRLLDAIRAEINELVGLLVP